MREVHRRAARVSRDRLDRELACRGWTGSDLARAAGLPLDVSLLAVAIEP